MTQTPHVFVVDDEASAREMVSDYLAMHGFQTTQCDGGRQMREELAKRTPDLIVLDLNMPQEDGLSIIRYLKDHCHAPIIMLTASASTIDRVVGLELGADDYIAKPCELRELLARARSVLRRQKFSPARSPERRLAAIVSFDIVGFSRFIQEDEPGTLGALDAIFGGVITPSVLRHNGVLFKMLGDGALIEFPSVVDAANWSVEFQQSISVNPITKLPIGTIVFRVGVAVGDVVLSQSDRVGEGVTLAVRVQECAEPGGIALADQAYQLLRGKTSVNFADMGMLSLKNVSQPMRIWKWRREPAVMP
jgi:class 3 adenylate cyclase